MSLLGLLAMGRAFGTVRRRPPSYQVAEGWLPDFGRRQERVMGDLDGHETVLAASSWPERNLGGDETTSLFAVRPGAPREPVGAGVSRLKPAETTEGRSERTPGTARPAGGEALVQGDLSLQSVRVVRNELLADDLELISEPSRRGAATSVSRPRALRPSGGGWRGWLTHWWCLVRRRAC